MGERRKREEMAIERGLAGEENLHARREKEERSVTGSARSASTCSSRGTRSVGSANLQGRCSRAERSPRRLYQRRSPRGRRNGEEELADRIFEVSIVGGPIAPERAGTMVYGDAGPPQEPNIEEPTASGRSDSMKEGAKRAPAYKQEYLPKIATFPDESDRSRDGDGTSNENWHSVGYLPDDLLVLKALRSDRRRGYCHCNAEGARKALAKRAMPPGGGGGTTGWS